MMKRERKEKEIKVKEKKRKNAIIYIYVYILYMEAWRIWYFQLLNIYSQVDDIILSNRSREIKRPWIMLLSQESELILS